MFFFRSQILQVFIFSTALFLLSCTPPVNKIEPASGWPVFTVESKPWTRWWWQGNALTKEGITGEMEAYQQAGIGGLEITPIYGVYGEEDQFVQYLSPQYMDLLIHVLKEAERLEMGIDMATGTGWPFGGPWVTNEDASKNLRYKIFELKGGARLNEKIEFIQEPYLRLVGNQIHHQIKEENGRVMDTRKIRITDLKDPVNENKNLQALAIDQIQFEKPLKLISLVAYDDENMPTDLFAKVDAVGNLDWVAPPGSWKLYAVFEGFHGKMVERAGPGGEGNVIDHFSDAALRNYLAAFDNALKGHDIRSLRAFFNDSYEVDDARGAADFTPELFDEFKSRRGYDLRGHLPALFGKDVDEKNRRVLSDYRETLSDLLLDNFTSQWNAWADGHDALVRNQAHGSPANILDLYAVVDIPEIEGTEPLRFKMATSSGNVSGKKLISAEAATWLNEHFESNLADIKEVLDDFMLHGVNHLVYHGTCYSPPGEAWPGRLFYAAVHLNPRNPLWEDFDALNAYVTRCQSFLQNSTPDNDVLLYYPIYDRFASPGREMIEHFDGIGQFEGSTFARSAETMLEKGYAFDYISDKQLLDTRFENGSLTTSGQSAYKILMIPQCEYMPLETLEKILSLVQSGAPVIFIDKMPGTVNGLNDLDNRTKRFKDALGKLASLANNHSATGSVQSGSDIEALLNVKGIQRNSMVDAGIQMLRKKTSRGGSLYFIKNKNARPYDDWVRIRNVSVGVTIFDPMTGKFGNARMKTSPHGASVYLQLEPGQTVILRADDVDAGTDFPYYETSGEPTFLSGTWNVSFQSGGPRIPASFTSDSLIYWTSMEGEGYQDFSGTAAYELTFAKPEIESERWLLKLDSVKESAEIILNGESLGTLIGPDFQIEIDGTQLKEANVLQVKVSNLMANRIAWLDRNNIFWKKFYNIGFPARKRENAKNNLFNASHWKPKPSGISGTAALFPLKGR